MNGPDEIAALADEGCCETPLSHHVTSFWNLLKTETVHLSVNIRRVIGHDAPAGPTVYYDCSTFSDDVAKELVRLSATSPGDAVREALEESKNWHERADKALSKSGRGDADYHWRRNQHKEEIERIEAALAPAEKAGDDPLDDLVARFSAALLAKLKDAREKYGYADEGWQYDDWRLSCREQLLKHLAKGDPRDVAAYCAFMWHHGWSTVAATPTPPSVDVVKVGKTKCHWCSGKGTRELGVGAAVVCGRCGGAKYDELIQSAAHGGGTKSDGLLEGSLPSGESELAVTPASGPSDAIHLLRQVTQSRAVDYVEAIFPGWHDRVLTLIEGRT